MSVDQLPPGKARPAKRDAQLVRYDEYIDKQIETTRRNVKAVDVMTALLVMATGALAFLLAAAVVEHWFVAGGFNVAVRLLLFVALVGGLSFYAARRLWPLCVGSINPAYAAQAIEQDNPSLKNSLLNLLLFRQHRDDITDAVYETLEEQAAQRLTHVPVDSAVDRSQLLRLGYVLMVIVAVAALYKILSPKDPFVTAERVLMPWASIVPASRVSIENVEPGTATLARGEVLTVSADVRGIGDDDPVVVRYTTADGQAVDRPAPMTPSAAGLRFTGQIPPPQDAAQGGIAQNLRYRIEAGDARSLEYSVTVVSAPTITVERIDYDYPEYTGFVDRSIERLGDVRAIDGTRVTIHARANQPIEEAAIDFEADGRRDVRFEASDGDARATFLLELRDDRQTPKFTSYVLRFTGTDGRPNRDPVKFPIDVLPDYGPEVAILAPAEKVRDVRLDETVAIEVDARDPDFALAEVHLHGDAAGRTVLDEKLLGEEHTGRFTGRILFTPSEHDLQAGDIVRYWVTARDNRAPQPNEVTSDSQSLRIVALDPRQPGQPPQDRVAQRDKREPQDGSQTKEGEQQPGGSASADGQSGQSDEQNSANQSGENSSGEQSNDQTGESETGGEPSGDGQSSASEQSGESGETQQQPGGAPSAGKNGESSEQDQSHQSTGGGSSGEQRDANQSEANPGTNDQGGGEGSKNSQPQPGNRGQSKPGDEPSPVSPEGDNDGEAFERIQDFLKREGKLPKEGDSKPQTGESASADGNQGDNEQGDGKPNQQSDAESISNDQTDPNADNTSEQPGTNSRPSDTQEKTSESSDQSSESPPADGQETSSEGESGAAEQPERGEGSPESQPNMKPGEKWQQKPSGEKQDSQQEPPSGGHGKRESDTPGDSSGDRSGGEEEGAGQKSQRDGTGSAGQNQSADEGAGESSEHGAGQDSQSAGQDAKSNERTGQSGSEEKGQGSAERDGAGEKSDGSQQMDGADQHDATSGGEDAPARPDGEPASAGGDQSQTPNQEQGQSPSEQPNNGSQDSGASTTGGAGRVPNGTMQPTKSTGTAPAADAANIEYSRKQTDLVLETLAEQMKRQKVDKRLLDELGWTEADLQRFLARWQQLKAAAEDDSPSADAAQRELDEALRSLGLRRGSLEQAKVSEDANRNLRQGYRGAVPLEYQERLRAYNQGVSRARPTDE